MVNYCRTCGIGTPCNMAEDLFEQPQQILLHQIEELTGLLLLDAPTLPSLICRNCEDLLHQAIAFRDKILNTQQRLENLISDQYDSNSFPDVDGNEADITQIDHYEEHRVDIKSEEDIEEFIQADAEEPPIHSVELEKKLKKEEEFLECEFSNDSDGTIEFDLEDLHESEISSEICASDLDQSQDTKDLQKFSDSDSLDEDMSKPSSNNQNSKKNRIRWQQLTDEEAMTLRRELRKGDFICDQCGRHFICQSNLKLHLLRHTGVKDFSCSLCPMKFYTSSLLRRHEKFHREGHPYVCSHCPKSFANTVSRLVHERTYHTNFMPFKCSTCEKSFAVKSKLDEHMITHTRIRSFPCETCNVSFMTKKHLRKHKLSKIHKKNDGKLNN